MKADKLEEVRIKAGISQQRFADILGLSLSTYRRVITGDTTKYHDSINIAERLYKETGFLLFQIFYEDFDQDDKLRTIDKVSRLSEQHLKMIEKYADLCGTEATYFDADRMMALQILEEMYHKIIMLDLTNDTYVPYRVDTLEWNSIKNKTGKISVWIKSFANDGFVHPDDIEDFLAFMNVTNLKKMLRRETGFFRHKYRRKNRDAVSRLDDDEKDVASTDTLCGKSDAGWSWCMMEIKRSADYAPDHPKAIVYIRMVDEDYA